MNRNQNAVIANETIKILEQGFYTNSTGNRVNIREKLEHSKTNTKLYTPEELSTLMGLLESTSRPTRIEVTGETSLEAAKRLTSAFVEKVICLNFASAKNPGGGFLGGAQAQEESLARSSGLYASLITQQQFYDFHRKQGNLLYSDHMIYSPDVSVFRDDSGALLGASYVLSFITSPAPNAGAISKNTPGRSKDVKETLELRAAKLLALAVSLGYSRIILGAWGCGVFRNSPLEVADIFKHHLEGMFKGQFTEIVFAVFDNTKDQNVIGAFHKIFGEN
ncbi:MAG: TIGR02452 family protein [Trueperaceae bacterium]